MEQAVISLESLCARDEKLRKTQRNQLQRYGKVVFGCGLIGSLLVAVYWSLDAALVSAVISLFAASTVFYIAEVVIKPFTSEGEFIVSQQARLELRIETIESLITDNKLLVNGSEERFAEIPFTQEWETFENNVVDRSRELAFLSIQEAEKRYEAYVPRYERITGFISNLAREKSLIVGAHHPMFPR